MHCFHPPLNDQVQPQAKMSPHIGLWNRVYVAQLAPATMAPSSQVAHVIDGSIPPNYTLISTQRPGQRPMLLQPPQLRVYEFWISSVPGTLLYGYILIPIMVYFPPYVLYGHLLSVQSFGYTVVLPLPVALLYTLTSKSFQAAPEQSCPA